MDFRNAKELLELFLEYHPDIRFHLEIHPALLSEELKENACKQIILGRFGKPEDIANMAAYLASEKAAYITGQIISVDGGMAI